MAPLHGSWDPACLRVLPTVLTGLSPIRVDPFLLPQLCANLDTWRIMSPQTYRPQLQELRPQPCKQYNLCHRRRQVRGGGESMGSAVKWGHLALSPDSTPTNSGTSGYLLISLSLYFSLL